MSSNLIRWLHLSDFHVGKDDYGQRRLFKYILENVQAKVEAGEAPHLVFITGDIADKGLPDQYRLFEEEFLQPLRESLPADCASRIFIVPGNHDVDRTKAEAVATHGTLSRVPRFLDPTQEGLSKRKVIFERFEAFANWHRGKLDDHWLFGPEGAFWATHERAGCRIGILGLNTAWLSFNDNDRHQLSAGKSIIEDGLEKIKECHMRIVLGHHPIDWFLDDEVESVRALFGRQGVLYLHGHLHKNQSRPDSGAENPFRIIQSGAAFQEREKERWVNRFLWCGLDLEHGRIVAEPLKWSKDCQEWAIDSDAFPEKLRVAGQDLWGIPLPGQEGPRATTAESHPRIWNIPHAYNRNFTGRVALLEKLEQTLNSSANKVRAAVLHGLGGVGKTQIVLRHVYDRQEDYSLVWWLRAEEPATLALDYAALAPKLGLGPDSVPQEAIQAVKSWLATHDGWLLVFDNAEKPEDLKEYLPQRNGGAIITSRNPNWLASAEPIPVGVLPPEDAADFLVKRTRNQDREGALKLAEELDCLPLALEQAGAYIEACGSSCEKYLKLFREQHDKLLKQGKPLDYPDTVATTWKLSFESLRKECPAAADLMELCAFFAPEAIPFDLFSEHPEHLPDPLKDAVKDPLQWDEVKAALKHYSLAEVTQDSLSFHRLVQLVVRNGMAPAARKRKVAAVMRLINEAYGFKDDDLETWPRAKQLLPQGLSATEYSRSEQVDDEPTGRLLNEMGWHLRILGQFLEAKGLLGGALTIAEKVYGPNHPVVAAVLNNLGLVLHDLGNLEGAKGNFERAMKIDEKVYGPNHPAVAIRLNNLGRVLQALGDLQAAKAIFERAMEIDENIHGPDHTAIARDLNNLGSVLHELGELKAAEANYVRALNVGKKVFGSDHLRVATVLNNLGLVLHDLGDLEGAKANFERALAIDEKVYGLAHPTVAIRRNNLGMVLKDLGDLEGARAHIERALEIDEKVYGLNHPAVAIHLSNLGGVLGKLGDLEGAKAHFTRALAMLRGAWGDDHPKTRLVLKNLKSLKSD
ncbi:MAG: tetratricopeptide repeat protein [Desulfomonile tiedjei]|nr:tetratricopeptide repeat protein [Desulfomonile tiedjei]